MNSKLIAIGFFTFVLFSCRTVNPFKYFKLNENQVDSFIGSFTKDKTDTSYMEIEQLFPNLAVADNFQEKYQIIYRTKNIDGHKAFYAIATNDTIYKDASFGSNHFLFSALIFEKEKVLIAPAFHLKDLNYLKFSDFKFIIPESISKRDSIRITDRQKETVLHSFRFEKLNLFGRNYKHCLVIDIQTKWPDTVYNSKVWLHKEYGILKWIRDTGRTDTRLL